jgi:DNA-binding transcriptional MerR regulator
VRAIQQYHHRGLLAEPGRDASGYRRYDGRPVAVTHIDEAGAP